ncbi:MAG TPA: hypothetical protein DCP63_13630 [Bacteroidetes bacterium]|nr:hypothetical protein [Bacteroidota bacterium]
MTGKMAQKGLIYLICSHYWEWQLVSLPNMTKVIQKSRAEGSRSAQNDFLPERRKSSGYGRRSKPKSLSTNSIFSTQLLNC